MLTTNINSVKNHNNDARNHSKNELQKQVDTPFAIGESRLAHGNKTLKKVKL